MTSNSEFGSISFDLPKNQSNVIKVIGVGGGGSNAINHMFKQGIKGVDFIVCNTDSQALQNSVVPNKIQLGLSLTEGLGAGANPEIGQQSALESILEIEKMLDTNTKMLFITAGMGGGTGTGAAPVIAQLARERDILTVGIVTIPFLFEGKVRSDQAIAGVEKLRKQVDSLIVINNNKLREVYGNLGFKAGFSKADEVLATASRGIAEVITHHYTQNIDLKDAKTVLANSGTAIMGSSTAMGENRAKEAIINALDSPLLNDNKISGAKNVLLLIVSGTSEITIDEIGEINDYIQNEAGHNANIIMGVGEDETLEEAIAVTIIATGFNIEQQNDIVNTEPKKIIHALEDEQKIVHDLSQKKGIPTFDLSVQIEKSKVENKIIFDLEKDEIENQSKFEIDLVPTSEFVKNLDVTFEIISPYSVTEQDFFIVEPEAKKIESVSQATIKEEEQITFSFDLPIDKEKPLHESEVFFELTQEIKEIEVKDSFQVIPSIENETEMVKYSLEDYMEVENEFIASKPIVKVVEEPINETLNLRVKEVELADSSSESFQDISPFNMSIEETLKTRIDERKKKMKEFNYKFRNSTSKVDEFEKEPAYKRMGIDISNNSTDNGKSRISLGTDSNDDLQFRSNNSYLHDNVD